MDSLRNRYTNAEQQEIDNAKSQLLNVVHKNSSSINSIKPADPKLKTSYAEALKEIADCRGVPLRFPYLGSGRGNGAFVELLDGSVKYDFISGIGVYALGHSHPLLIASEIDAALKNTPIQGNLQQNYESLELHRLLRSCSGIAHSFLSTSGAMAVENGLKIAFQKKAPAQRILAFEHCFAGRTLALSQLTDKPSFRDGLPLTIAIDYVPYYDPADPENSIKRAIHTLKNHIWRYPKGHAAMIFELVQGEGGVNCGNAKFFSQLMQILKEEKIAVFVDEIQTFGRMPKLFAFQHFNLESFVDICTIGKLSLSCATLFTEEYAPRPGLLSQTFTSPTASIISAKVIIETLMNGNFFGDDGKIMKLNRHFTKRLEKMTSSHPGIISGPFGLGGMIAFTPYDGEDKRVNKLVDDLFEAGVITFVAGNRPTRVRMLPPFGIISNDDIDAVCDIIEKTLLVGK